MIFGVFYFVSSQLQAKRSKNPQKALKRQAANALLMPNLSVKSQGEVFLS